MSRFYCVSFALIALLVTTSAFGQRTGSSTKAERAQVRAADTVAGLQKNLKDARRLLVAINDKKVRERLELLLARAALQADDLEELLGDLPRRRPTRPISDADFAKLLKGLQDESFDDDKNEFIETFVKGRPINCKQATEILKTLSFDDGRIKAAIAIYPAVVDSENFFEVLKVFPFEASRTKVMAAVKKKKTNRSDDDADG